MSMKGGSLRIVFFLTFLGFLIKLFAILSTFKRNIAKFFCFVYTFFRFFQREKARREINLHMTCKADFETATKKEV